MPLNVLKRENTFSGQMLFQKEFEFVQIKKSPGKSPKLFLYRLVSTQIIFCCRNAFGNGS